jgi:hypothetical protein
MLAKRSTLILNPACGEIATAGIRSLPSMSHPSMSHRMTPRDGASSSGALELMPSSAPTFARRLNATQVAFDPYDQCSYMTGCFPTERSECVLDTWGDFWKCLTVDETICLQGLECLSQHLFAYTGDLAPQLAETVRAFQQCYQH